MRVMRQMDQVLESSGVEWHRGAGLDPRPYITAMLRLCQEQHVDDHPIDHLRQVARVMESLRGTIDPAGLKAGEENAAQYERWLSSTFPKAFAQIQKRAAQRVRKLALN